MGKVLERPHRSRQHPGETNQAVAFGVTNFPDYRIRALLYAGKPNWDLLCTVTRR